MYSLCRLLVLLFLSAGSLFALARVQVPCTVGGKLVILSGQSPSSPSSSTKVQASYPNCTVNVYITGSGGVHATIYSANFPTLTPLSNPFTADSTGFAFFYVSDGYYDIQISGGISPSLPAPYTYGSVSVVDPYFTFGPTATPYLKSSDMHQRMNVFDFGAHGDCTTDDTAAIQAAIDAATTVNQSVFFPAIPSSCYAVSHPILVHTNTTLQGDTYNWPGDNNTLPTVTLTAVNWVKTTGDAIIQDDGTTPPGSASPFNNVFIDRISVSGPSSQASNTNGPDYGYHFRNADNIFLSNLYVKYSKLDGIFYECNNPPPILICSGGIINNVVVTGAAWTTAALTAVHAGINIGWTDTIVSNGFAGTSTDAVLTQGGKKVGCYITAASQRWLNMDCAHSEVGIVITGNGNQLSNVRTDFDATDGWQIKGGGNTISGAMSIFDGTHTPHVSAGFNITGSGQTLTGAIVVNGNSGFALAYGFLVNDLLGDPPDQFWGCDGSGGDIEIGSTSNDYAHIMWNGYRPAPVQFIPAGITGPINVYRVTQAVLANGATGTYQITGFTNGVPGQEVMLYFNGNANPPTMVTSGTVTLTKPWTPENLQGQCPFSSISFKTIDGINWVEKSRTDCTVGIGSQTGQIFDPAEAANNQRWLTRSNTGNKQLLFSALTDAGVETIWGVVTQNSGIITNYNVRAPITPGFVTFANLPTGSTSWTFCSNCNIVPTSPHVCTSGGTGAWTFCALGVCKCPF